MNWFLGIVVAIVGLALLDTIWIAAMVIGHKLHEMSFRRTWNRMHSRKTPCQVYAWPDEDRTA